MSIEFLDSSPVAAELIDKPKTARTRQTYPFDKLEVGKSFRLPIADAKVKSLQMIALRKSIDGKRFEVVTHKSIGFVEVARLS